MRLDSLPPPFHVTIVFSHILIQSMEQEIPIRYGSRKVRGEVGYIIQDTVSLRWRSYDRRTALCWSNVGTWPRVCPRSVYGILEFGYDSTEVSRIIRPVYNMANQGLLDETLFAFYLGGINDESARV